MRISCNNTDGGSYLYFGDSADADAGNIRYAHSIDAMYFYTNGNQLQMALTSAGRLGVNNTSPIGPFEVLDANISTSDGAAGFYISAAGQMAQSTDNAAAFYMNDTSSSAGTHNYIIFRYQGTSIGDIDTTDNSTI